MRLVNTPLERLTLQAILLFFYGMSIVSYLLLYPFGFIRGFTLKMLPPRYDMISPWESQTAFDKLDFWTFGHSLATIVLCIVLRIVLAWAFTRCFTECFAGCFASGFFNLDASIAGVLAWLLMFAYEIGDGLRGEGASSLDISANTLGLLIFYLTQL